MSCYKAFSKELYNRHDVAAKETVKSLLKQTGYTVINEDEAYGDWDFVVEREGKPYTVEVEWKDAWKTLAFPYSTLHVCHRKRTSKADLFFQVSANHRAIAGCPMETVLRSPVIRKDTIYTKNEPFFSVPVEKFKFYDLEDGVWYYTD